MNGDLLRQRRNLIMVSGGLLLFDFADVSVAKISLFGTELLVGDARVLFVTAWLTWSYFLLRYYQYLRAEGDLGINKGIASSFQYRAKQYVHEVDGRKGFQGEINFSRRGMRWTYAILEQAPNRADLLQTKAGSLPLIQSWWWTLSAYLYVTVHTPRVTDHVLPFALAFAAPAVSVSRLM